MRKVYVDVGCGLGGEIRMFFEGGMEDPTGYTAIGIDPIKQTNWEELKNKYPVEFIDKVAWIRDGMVDFSEIKESFYSSSIMKLKRDYKKGVIKQVECFDFPKWFEQFRDDEVIIKMNIEGAETAILDRMIRNDQIRNLKKLMVELHYGKIGGDFNYETAVVERELKKYPCFVPMGDAGYNWLEWRDK